MLASPVDEGVLVILRRHSTEGTLCDNVSCSVDDPALIDVVDGQVDEFGFVTDVECLVCHEIMSTKCYDQATSRKMRILSADELKPGDHIAWHTTLG